jgi:DNA-binding response OmpR family regulator
VQLITKPFTIAELATRVREVLETAVPLDAEMGSD